MIKLHVNLPGQTPLTYRFYKQDVIIGQSSTSDLQPDLALSAKGIEPSHLKIFEQGGRFFVANDANDPYTTLNGLPFGKKILKDNDILQIGEITILFESHASEEEVKETLGQNKQQKEVAPEAIKRETTEKPYSENEKHLLEILEQAMSSKHIASPASISKNDFPSSPARSPAPAQFDDESFDLDEELRKLEESLKFSPSNPSSANIQIKELDLHDIEELLNRVQNFDKESLPKPPLIPLPPPEDVKSAPPPPRADKEPQKSLESPPEQTKTSPVQPRQSLKDDYLREFDDESEGQESKDKKSHVQGLWTLINWRLVFMFLLILAVIGIVIMGLIYISASVRSEEEELKAAEGVADVAMALTYAQINHAVPQNQNWSDPDFLKNNLSAVLASDYLPLSNLDSHGQFLNTGYMLRIYTSSDLSQFLVIAQPSPNSLLQWMIPKKSILVDSTFMDLRKTDDLKTLNRLLVNPALDRSNASEISALVKQGSIIPLSLLANKLANQGFSPPKALAFLRPGAENLIYNAPRYYHFGESLMKKALGLYDLQDNLDELAVLRDEMQSFAKFPNIVLYSPEGIQAAIASQKALSTFMPEHNFLFAYLQFDAKGMLTSSHLVIDDTASDALPDEEVADNTSIEPSEIGPFDDTLQSEPSEQKNAYLGRFLASLYNERQQALKAIRDNIVQLLQTENRAGIPNFHAKLQALQRSYDETLQAYQVKVVKALSLINLVETAGLEDASLALKDDLSDEADPESEAESKPRHPTSTQPKEDEPVSIDKNHPLFFRLTALYNARQQTLKPISDQMVALLDAQNEASSAKITDQLNELEKKYERTASELQTRIVKSVSDLYREYSYMPLSTFMDYVKAAGLDSIVKEKLQNRIQQTPSAKFSPNKVRDGIAEIQKSDDLKELDAALTQTTKLLTLSNLSDASEIIEYQNLIRDAVSQKLEGMLLAPDTQLTAQDYTRQNKVLLSRILKTAWINDPDEVDYFLNEFEVLSHHQRMGEG